jgi:hypothetical protein
MLVELQQRIGNRTKEQGELLVQPRHYEVAVIGTGPQGLALANELLKRDINFALVGKPRKSHQRRPAFGGELTTYDIPANSKGNELLLPIQEGEPLGRVPRRRSSRKLARMTDRTPNLKRQVGPYLRSIGREIIRLRPDDVYAREVHHAVWNGEKHILFDEIGEAFLTADYVSFNIGAHERSLVNADPRFAQHADRIISSLDIIRGRSLGQLRRELRRTPKADRFIIIVGTSHTAFTDAAILTKGRIRIGRFDRSNSQVIRFLERIFPKTVGDYIPEGHLLIAYRGDGDIKVFAENAAIAVAEGLEQGPVDAVDSRKICPVTKRYRRFGGFREWAKEIYLAWKKGLEPRIELIALDDISDEVLKRAIIVQAIGLEGNEFDVLDDEGISYPLPREHGNITARANGELLGIPNAFGGGIGVDVLLPGSLGGEPEFSYPDRSTRHLHFVAGDVEVARRTAEEIAARRR